MCGIVGILGRQPVAGALLDALKRLEYRGYDSAGVATLEGGRLTRRRAEGKLRNLEARLASEPGQVVTRQRLLADVWDEHWYGSTKTLDVHVACVRRRLGER